MTTIQPIKVDDVINAYRGKIGCGCGCRGKYYAAVDGSRAKHEMMRITNMINDHLAEVVVEDNDLDANQKIVSLEMDGKSFIVYVKKEVL